ncbi:glycosyltransferase [Segetibacter sp. 3557_3]|uniref:glycosyltransferase family 4 protein n=1 Tax=Segetibacter sp. 3557_3 TaxID=2547429 RepID=UPI001058E756|nr:glycosyltransferase family 4 protein [Segetibacter sp. 3557_3]TDH20839.1 glycosyltransferase [Segetibacter sp. 3557_3]
MRITFIATLQQTYGGSEVLWVKMAENAVSRGHEIQVVVYAQTDGLHPALAKLQQNATFVEMPNSFVKGNKMAAVVRYVKGKLMPYNLDEVVKFKPDCIVVNQVHTYSAPFHPAINDLLHHSNFPFYLISHFNTDHEVLSYADIVKARSLFKKAKKISFVSERNKEIAEKQLAVRLPNAEVISNHPEISKLKYLDYPAEEQPIKFASVARLEANFKGQDILLEIFKQEKWRERSWHLNLYGSGPDENYLRDLCSFYSLDSKVTFHGHVPGIEAVWKENHALLLPSIAEGKPLALIEAMMCGRIGIASDVAGNGELIDDLENGYLASSFFVAPFGKTLENAWQQKSSWAEMGKKANRKILETIDFNPHQTFMNKIEREHLW